ncbi:MAG TPA: glycosyltransferase, partial [Blastocatellia bacterium]|nr:glycosyltransferase [Blastocatellia bacterium]
MKIAHITTIDLSLRYLLLNQMKSIQDAGYEVVGISAPGPHAEFLEREGIRHIAVPMTRNFTPFADFGALLKFIKVMRRERFTIVHTHTPKPGLIGQLAARL